MNNKPLRTYKPVRITIAEIIKHNALPQSKLEKLRKADPSEELLKLTSIIQPEFVEGVSTCFTSTARFGKTYHMMQWANQMASECKPYIYLLTCWHIGNKVDKHYGAVYDTRKAPKDFKHGESALLTIMDYPYNEYDRKRGYLELCDIIGSAIQSGYHIFVDENAHRFNILQDLITSGYKNFTVALSGMPQSQFSSTINESIFDIGLDRIFYGRHNDPQINKTASVLIGCNAHSLADLQVGEFVEMKSNLEGARHV